MAKRLTRKKLKQKDEFITTTEKLVNLAVKHKSYFFVIGITILFFAVFSSIGFYYYRDYSKKGSLAYFQDLHLYEIALKTGDKSDITNAMNAFDSFRNNFKFISISKLALIYLGNCEYMMGNYDKAIESYNTFISEWGSENDYIAAIAYNGIVQSYIAKKDYKSALGIIDKLLNYKDNSLKQLTYLHAIDCYMNMEQPDKALELLENGVKKYSNNSMLKDQLINFIAYVKAKKHGQIVNLKLDTF